jgi:ketosteroid isomerase-like protein
MEMSDATNMSELQAAIRTFGEAWARGDCAALAALLSPSYTHNDATGDHLKRDAWLAYAAKRTGRGTQITFRDVETRIFGDLAVVTGFNDISGGGVLNPDDSRDLTIAFTQVWRRENGRWLREAFQATPVQNLTYE